jgi:serine protease Do
VRAYDLATGFGLLQALVPLKRPAARFGRVEGRDPREPLMVASGGGDGAVSMAQLVSRRAFAGYWEYFIDGALFTAPAHGKHSGAGLFNLQGELLGVGSLRVADAAGADQPRLWGNMFVPVDLLRPILADLMSRGHAAHSERAWLGLNCLEIDGQVRVARVSEDSPAQRAGLRPGDRIVRLDGTAVGSLAALWQSLWSGGAAEREVVLDVQREGQPQRLAVQTADRMKSLKRAQGI